jgi:hypothetical protein
MPTTWVTTSMRITRIVMEINSSTRVKAACHLRRRPPVAEGNGNTARPILIII